MRSISSWRSPLETLTWIFCSLPVPRSFAETCTMPFASMSNETSICGTPRGAAGMPTRSNRASVRLSFAISRSPCTTWMLTAGWLSVAVEKIWPLRHGMAVLRSMSFVMSPPRVSMPSESGVTSRRRSSSTSPERTPAWIAAPIATTSSGLTPLCGSFLKKSFTTLRTSGVRVEPPTRMISSTSPAERPASRSACSHGSSVRWTSG